MTATYGIASKKLPCQYLDDDGTTIYNVYHTQDVITAGTFTAGSSSAGSAMPSKGRLIPRHVGLFDSTGGRRCKVPIGTPTAFASLAPGQAMTYAGVTWAITSTTGQKERSRA